MLPNMDGWEFLALIKRTPDLRRIPVVIISIVPDPSKGFSFGAAAVMQKPISRQALFESLVDIGVMPLKGEPLTILVVDDDPAAVKLIAAHVVAMDAAVLESTGGGDAIDQARSALPDVIVLDLMMPDVSGFEVVAALQESVETARIPILVVTSLQLTPDDRARLNGNVTAIMEKATFRPEKLIDEIRRAMSGRTQAA
jgi:CheY-like chemotaxis protein